MRPTQYGGDAGYVPARHGASTYICLWLVGRVGQVCGEKLSILHISIIIRHYYFKSEGFKMFNQCQSLKRACQ